MSDGDPYSSLRSLQLTPAEKSSIRRVIVEYMRVRPQPSGFSWYLWVLRPGAAFALASLIVLFGGSAIGWAAERALPGEPLYVFKVTVNERLRSAAAIADPAQSYDLDCVERRLFELEQLQAQHRLTDTALMQAQPELVQAIASVQYRVQRLAAARQTVAAATLNSKLEASLKIHQEIFSSADGQNNPADSIHTIVSVRSDQVAHTVVIENEKAHSNPAEIKATALALFVDAQAHLHQASDDLAGAAPVLSDLAKSECQDRLSQAATTLEFGRQALNQANYVGAIEKFQTVERLSHEVHVLIRVRSRLPLDPAIRFPSIRDTSEPSTQKLEVPSNPAGEILKSMNLNVSINTNMHVDLPDVNVPDASQLANRALDMSGLDETTVR